MFNHDPKDDAYKKDQSRIERMEIDLTGKVSPETVADILKSIYSGAPFILFNDEGIAFYTPLKLQVVFKSVLGEVVEMFFKDSKDFMHSIKLTLLTHNGFMKPDLKPKIITSENFQRKISGRRI